MYEDIKKEVLKIISRGEEFRNVGRSLYRVRSTTIHIRYNSSGKKRKNEKYFYNINPSTLTSDYELWICGDSSHYYLIPVSVMQYIYDNPYSYIDRHHPEIRVANIDATTHIATYGRGGEHMNMAKYFMKTL